MATVGGVVGRPNRRVLDTELLKPLLTIVLLERPEARTPLLKIDGRRADNPAKLLRGEPIDGAKLLLENRRPGRPVEEDKTGVGLIPPILDGEPDDRKRKNWLPLRDEDSPAVLLAMIGETPDGRNRLLNGAGRLTLLLLLPPLIEAGLGEIGEEVVVSSLTLTALVKGGRLGLVGKGGRGRWVNGLMAGTKVRLRGGADRRVVIRPPSTLELSLSCCSSTTLSGAGDVLIV